MDWKAKANTIILTAILLCVFSGAVTVIVSSEEDAAQRINTNLGFERGFCEISSVSKTITSQAEIGSADYEVLFVMHYSCNGAALDRYGSIKVKEADNEAIKAAVEKPCENLWLGVQAEEICAIDEVVIDLNSEKLPVMNEIYDYGSKEWLDKKVT